VARRIQPAGCPAVRLRPVLLALVLTAAPACGSSKPEPAPLAALPDGSTAAMAKRFDSALKPLGWRIQRSAFEHVDIDPAHPTTGKQHLAVYVRPLGTPSYADYVNGLSAVTKLFVPALFDQYADLASFDVCEEPTEAQDPADEPKPVTQIVVTRANAHAVAWATATPAEVVAAGTDHPNKIGLYASADLRASPEWGAIVAHN
jgi:hypothetical protein